MFSNMTVSELRKECRSMNPTPATGVAISGANKDMLLGWLDGTDPQTIPELKDDMLPPSEATTTTSVRVTKEEGTDEAGYVVRQPVGDKTLQTAVYGHAGLAENIAKAFAGYTPPANNIDEARIKELIKEHSPKPKSITVKHFDGSKVEVGAQHKNFSQLLLLASQRIPAFLAGPSGSGKTHSAKQLADALKLPFSAISVGPLTTEAKLLGYNDVNGTYHETELVKRIKHGGVFLVDEADAGNAGVLTVLNMVMSNGIVATPEGMIEVHPDFYIMAGANTYGTGADRQYVGRVQLDEATLKRFFAVEWDIDESIENEIAGADDDASMALVAKMQELRANVEKLKLRVTVSPRDSKYGVRLLKAGMKQKDILKGLIYKNLDQATITKIEKGE